MAKNRAIALRTFIFTRKANIIAPVLYTIICLIGLLTQLFFKSVSCGLLVGCIANGELIRLILNIPTIFMIYDIFDLDRLFNRLSDGSGLIFNILLFLFSLILWFVVGMAIDSIAGVISKMDNSHEWEKR